MNRCLPTLLAGLVLLASCGSQPEAAKEPDVQVKSAATPVDPVVAKMDALKKMPALGLDELAAYLPSELDKMKKSNLTMSADMGRSVAHADYIRNSKTDIRVNIYDLAGENGAAIYRSDYQDQLGKTSENAEGYSKTTDINGAQAIEGFNKANNTTTLTFLSGDRVLVSMAARNIAPEKLREAALEIRKH